MARSQSTRVAPAVAVLLALCLAAPAHADTIDDLIRSEMAARRIPGLSLAVIRNGTVVKAQGYGYANLEHKVPAKRETIYQSGSMGKQFTATAVMQLVEDGKVQLDKPIGSYLPEAPPAWAKVTVRHLLNHTAGIWDNYFWGRLNLREDSTDAQLLHAAFSLDLTVEPGFAFGYSNAGYVVLGILISRVSGKPYAEFLRERIFQPLGMATARVIDEYEIIPDRAAGYVLVEGRLENQRWVAPSYNRTGDGGLYFSVDDLVKWDAGLYSETILGKSSLKEMWSPASTGSGAISEYGFGWFLDGIKGHRRMHHSGGWQGFTARIERYPDDRLTVAVLANLAPPDSRLREITAAVAQVYLRGEREPGKK
jgi:CubicO group peptidase (beta-lactamase class C family)